MAAAAITQYVNSEKARKLSQQEQDRLADLANRIQQPTFNENGTPGPAYDFSTLTPEDYKLVEKYIPEAAPVIAEQAPQVVERSTASKEGLAAQQKALRRLMQVSESNEDPELMAAINKAGRSAQQEAQSRQSSILEDAARRGLTGSGLSVMAQSQGASNAFDRAGEASQNAAVAAYKNRLNAMMQGAELGGQIGQQENQLAYQNANIINDFNRRMSQRAQDVASSNVDARNQASRYNIGQAQDISNRNVQQRNQSAWNERERADRLKYQQADWARQERNNFNDLQQKKYQNDTDLLGIQTGVGMRNIAANQQAAADRNQMIQGLSNAGVAGAMYYGGQQNRDEDWERRKSMAQYEKTGKWE